MKRFVSIGVVGVAVMVAAAAAFVRAEEITSGPPVNDVLGAFYVEKTGGAPNDGVDVGVNLCYRCRLGGRPMVMVFSRGADERLVALVEQLDKQVTAHEAKGLGAFVNFLGADEDGAKSLAKTFEGKNKAASVALVVPVDQPNGPVHYKLNPEADVTVILAVGGQVKASHALKATDLNEDAIKAIVADTSKILE